VGYRWANEDPQGAATYAQSLPQGNSRSALISSIASQWASKDPEAALAWAKSLPGAQSRDAVQSVVSAWANSDAAAAAAEMVLAVERRCSSEPGLVGTVGKLEVPGGAINVIPGRCEFSIDVRSGSDALRDAAAADIRTEIESIALRRGVQVAQRTVLEAAGVSCAPALIEAWSESVQRVTGTGARRLPSGAGHDAMMMASLTDVGMLFVRCGNGGISHHPMETLSATDAEAAAQVFRDFLQHVRVSP